MLTHRSFKQPYFALFPNHNDTTMSKVKKKPSIPFLYFSQFVFFCCILLHASEFNSKVDCSTCTHNRHTCATDDVHNNKSMNGNFLLAMENEIKKNHFASAYIYVNI